MGDRFARAELNYLCPKKMVYPDEHTLKGLYQLSLWNPCVRMDGRYVRAEWNYPCLLKMDYRGAGILKGLFRLF
jgi:hypothetical protein